MISVCAVKAILQEEIYYSSVNYILVRMGFMAYLQEASKNDLIDIIISLQSQLGEEITEERFAKKNKWPLVQTFIALEDSVHCGHPPKAPDADVQRGATYLSQDFVMFFCVSCEGLPGQ